MPTPDEYRSARCLLGLTQHQVGKMDNREIWQE